MDSETASKERRNDLPLALVTGASAGIGAEFARQIAAGQQHHLLLVARREDRLQQLASQLRAENPQILVHIEVCDLASNRQRELLVEQVRNLDIPLGLLINNAGFGSLGFFTARDWDREAEMIEVNVKAPMHLCHALVPDMVRLGYGAVINVCSTASFQSLPFMSTYAASKAFLLHFTLALSEEHRNSGVTFLAHCPGPTESEFHKVVGLSKKIDALPSMPTQTVVAQALAASTRGRQIFVNGTFNRLSVWINRLLPRSLNARFVAKIMRSYLPGKAR